MMILDCEEGNGNYLHDQSKYDRIVDINCDETPPGFFIDERYDYGLEFYGSDRFRVENSDEFEQSTIGVSLKIKTGDQIGEVGILGDEELIIAKQSDIPDGASDPQSINKGFSWVLSITETGYIKWSFWYVYNNPNSIIGYNYAISNTQFSLNSDWIFINAWTDGRGFILYINGIVEDQGILVDNGHLYYAGESRDILIGDDYNVWDNTFTYFHGQLDDLSLSNYLIRPIRECAYYDLSIRQQQGNEYYFHDVSNNDNQLTTESSSTWNDNGVFGKCVKMIGDSQDIMRITNSDVIDVESSFSIEAFVKITQRGTYTTIASQASDTENDRRCWEIGMNSNNHIFIKVWDSNSEQYITVTSPIDMKPQSYYGNNWHHVTGVFINREGANDNDEIQLFIDGYLYRGCIHRKIDINIEQSNQDIIIGGFMDYNDLSPSNVFRGYIDEIRFTNGFRTLCEDFDLDGMSDMNEIMRAVNSNQYNPYKHNSRNAVIATVSLRCGSDGYLPDWGDGYTGPKRDFTDDWFYYYSGEDMYKCLRELNYQDEDIVLLTTYNEHYNFEFAWEDRYEWSGAEWDVVFWLSNWEGINPPTFLYNFPVDGVITKTNFVNIIRSFQSGGQQNILLTFDEYNTITISAMTDNDNLMIYYADHGGNGKYCPNNPDMIEDQENDPSYTHDYNTLSKDEYVRVLSDPVEYNGDHTVKEIPGDYIVTEIEDSFYAFNEVPYFDDNFRKDLSYIETFNNIIVICHSCYSGGFIEDLSEDTDKYILVSSCEEDQSSQWFGPLFNEWLNERKEYFKDSLDSYNKPGMIIEDADDNINNNPGYEWVPMKSYPTYSNYKNRIISINEMYYNSVYTSYLHWYYLEQPGSTYYKPDFFIGTDVSEQVYL